MADRAKLKIAVQIYGHLRTYTQCAPYLKKHVLDRYDADVFIHTWDETEHTTKSWYDDSVRDNPLAVNDEVLAQVESLYHPRKLKVEPQGFLSETEFFGTHPKIQISLLGMKYMLYSQHQANLLRQEYEQETGVQYDYVLVVRPDIMPLIDLDFESFQDEFEFANNASIHLIHNSEIKLKDRKYFNYPLVGDCFYFARPDTINKITSAFVDFDVFYKKIKMIFPVGVENAEVGFFENLTQKGVLPRQYQFYFAIKRKEDKNDIRLNPPRLLIGNDPTVSHRPGLKSAIFQWGKTVLRGFVRHSPKPILQFVKRVLNILVIVERYIQTVEHANE